MVLSFRAFSRRGLAALSVLIRAAPSCGRQMYRFLAGAAMTKKHALPARRVPQFPSEANLFLTSYESRIARIAR